MKENEELKRRVAVQNQTANESGDVNFQTVPDMIFFIHFLKKSHPYCS